MTASAAARREIEPISSTEETLDARIAAIAAKELKPIALEIDQGTIYPEQALRKLGEAGAWNLHLNAQGEADLRPVISATSTIGETCGATAFMAWCQNTLVWYVLNSKNAALKSRFQDRVCSGALLGGTGLSNPMKSFFGIEKLKLKGRKVDGGYTVRGALPWVSNLGPDHVFGTIFEIEETGEKVMFIADCVDPNITLQPCKPFLAMDGTGTYSIQFRDAFVPDDHIIASPAMPFIKRIRAGFILMQTGMGLGLIRDCIAIMNSLRAPLEHINRYLPQQPEDFSALLDELETESMRLAATPYDTSNDYWCRVIEVRLKIGDASVAAAHAAMLHCGARGYLSSHSAQRRLRESYFVAIVTPATKQLRKMLAEAKAHSGDNA